MMGLDHGLVATPTEGEVVELTWRKFNALHNWFVAHNQNGEDDQQEYLVERDLLVALKNTLIEVMNDKTKAAELFPTQGGFFFGDTLYSEYYYIEVQKALNDISKFLEMPEGTKYTYWCWW